MAWKKRKPAISFTEPSGDVRLTPLTDAGWDYLAGLALQALAARGVTASRASLDSVAAANGAQYGLSSLAFALADQPVEDWAKPVGEHFDAVLAPRPRTDDLTLETARPHLLPRIMTADELAGNDFGVPTYAPQLGGGLMAVAALDYPTRVDLLLTDASVASIGPWAVIEPIALANLRAQPASEHDVLDGEETGPHYFTDEENHFVASRLLLLDELLASVGQADAGYGIVVAVPARAALIAYVLRDKAQTIRTLSLMGHRVPGWFESLPGPISPGVYWRPAPGQPLAQISAGTKEQMRLLITPELGAVLNALP